MRSEPRSRGCLRLRRPFGSDRVRAHLLVSKVAGFSLVELMIAAAITMMTTLLMFQVLTISETTKRATSSGNDGTRAGLVAMDQLGYLVRTAGAGLAQIPGAYGCLLTAYQTGTQVLPTSTALPAPFAGISGANLRMAPVLAFDGGTGPDILMLMSGSSPSANIAIPRGEAQVGGESIAATNTVGLMKDDTLLMTRYLLNLGTNQSQSADCFLTQIKTGSSDVDADGNITSNPIPVAGATFSAPTGVLPVGVRYTLSTLGANPSMLLIGVRRDANGRSDLVSYDVLRQIGPTVIAEDVIDFQVIYGVDTDVLSGRTASIDFNFFGDGRVRSWVAPTGDWSSERLLSQLAAGTAPTITGPERMRRIKTLGIAVITVDSEQAREAVSINGSALKMFSGVDASLEVSRSIGSGGLDAKSRYQVFESLIPVRNLSGGLSPIHEELIY